MSFDELPKLGGALLDDAWPPPPLADQSSDDGDLPVLGESGENRGDTLPVLAGFLEADGANLGGLSPDSPAPPGTSDSGLDVDVANDSNLGGLSPNSPASPSTSGSGLSSSDAECQSDADPFLADQGNSHAEHSPMMPTSVTGIFSHMDWAWRQLREKRALGQICSNLSKGSIKQGSLCSGFDISGMSFDGLRRACGTEVYPRVRCDLVKEVICEIHPKKFDLLMQMHPDVRHAYKNVLELSEGPCWDYKMNAVTDCSPDLLFAGFSCVDLSGFTTQTRSFKRDRQGKLKFGSTFFAVADCLRRWKCRVVVLENVRGLLWHRKVDGFRPIDKVDETLRAAGYLGTHRLLSPENYGIPQRRLRVYLLYFLVGSGDAEVAFSTAKLLQARSVPVSVYLGGLSPGPAPRSQRRRDTEQWPTKHAAFQTSHCLRPDVITWAESVLSGFTSGLRPRELSLLIKRYAYLKQVKHIDPTMRTAVLQIDQELDRCPTGLDVVPCVCPQGAYWITSGARGAPRFLGAAEVALLQGVGPDEVECYGLQAVPRQLLRDLAGNAFNGAVCNVVLLVALSGWHRV